MSLPTLMIVEAHMSLSLSRMTNEPEVAYKTTATQRTNILKCTFDEIKPNPNEIMIEFVF